MKIIAKGKDGHFICELHKYEVQKFRNLYFNKMDELKIGDEIDLGKGYDFLDEIRDALRSIEPLLKNKEKTISTIFEGVALLSGLTDGGKS